jgi:hypothetical protein
MYCNSDVKPLETKLSDDIIISMKIMTEFLNRNYDPAFISEEEVRPFLNAHFMSARQLSRLRAPPGTTGEAKRAHIQATVLALDIYKWLLHAGPSLAETKKVNLEQIFGAEMSITTEMCELLPSKIDRMHYLGEDALTFAAF